MESPSVPTTIFLVRHGATTWNDAGIYQGRTDVPLSPVGIVEAQALGARLRPVGFDAAYTSTLSRARDTALHVLAGTGVRPCPLSALDELSYGSFQGLHPAERDARDAALDQRWRSDPWSVTFPEGESLHEVEQRAAQVWDDIVAAHRGEQVLIVAHGHVNRVLLLRALRLPRDHYWQVEQENASVRILDCVPGEAAHAREGVR